MDSDNGSRRYSSRSPCSSPTMEAYRTLFLEEDDLPVPLDSRLRRCVPQRLCSCATEMDKGFFCTRDVACVGSHITGTLPYWPSYVPGIYSTTVSMVSKTGVPLVDSSLFGARCAVGAAAPQENTDLAEDAAAYRQLPMSQITPSQSISTVTCQPRIVKSSPKREQSLLDEDSYMKDDMPSIFHVPCSQIGAASTTFDADGDVNEQEDAEMPGVSDVSSGETGEASSDIDSDGGASEREGEGAAQTSSDTDGNGDGNERGPTPATCDCAIPSLGLCHDPIIGCLRSGGKLATLLYDGLRYDSGIKAILRFHDVQYPDLSEMERRQLKLRAARKFLELRYYFKYIYDVSH